MSITIDRLELQGDDAAALVRGLLRLNAPAPHPALAFFAGLQSAADEASDGSIPAIGAPWPEQGGVNGGFMRGVDGGPDYWLIVATDDAARTEAAWGGYGEDEPGAQSDHDGLANTRALIASLHPHPAAEFAGAARIGDHDDWYLPARREWRVLVGNVPELFESGYHWSSTQYSRYYAWCQDFSDGAQDTSGKDDTLRVRLVRRLFL